MSQVAQSVFVRFYFVLSPSGPDEIEIEHVDGRKLRTRSEQIPMKETKSMHHDAASIWKKS